LPAFGDQRAIRRSCDSEGAPESRALQSIKPTIDYQSVTQLCGAAVIDFGPDDHWIFLRLRHFGERKPKLFCQQCPRDLDETEVCDIGDDAATVGIEEHYLHFSADARLFRIHRRIDITASTTSGTLTAFMQRKSIGHSRKKHGLHST